MKKAEMRLGTRIELASREWGMIVKKPVPLKGKICWYARLSLSTF